MNRFFLAAPLFALLAGCTSMEPAIAVAPAENYSLVDPTKVDAEKYTVDFTQCAALANQNTGDMKNKVTDVARTAASKVSFGVIGSAKAVEVERGSVLRKCLTGRGYEILR